MQFSTLLNLGLAAISGVVAAPTSYFDVDITFIGGPASYSLTVPADGQFHATSTFSPSLSWLTPSPFTLPLPPYDSQEKLTLRFQITPSPSLSFAPPTLTSLTSAPSTMIMQLR